MHASGLMEAETVYCTVSFILFGFTEGHLKINISPHLDLGLQGKIKRTRSFYVDDFKYLKSLVPAEVGRFSQCASVSYLPICLSFSV